MTNNKWNEWLIIKEVIEERRMFLLVINSKTRSDSEGREKEPEEKNLRKNINLNQHMSH
jgi:hypothetical protein